MLCGETRMHVLWDSPQEHRCRRGRKREILQYPTTSPDSQWGRHSGGGGDKAKAQAPVSSVGEEKALLLGYIMMAFSILMYFVVGIAVVMPTVHNDWGDAINCSLIQVEFVHECDERAISYPCLQVLVNVTAEKQLYLRYDEAAVNLSPQCFYTPKNHQNKSGVVKEAQRIKDALGELQGQVVRCHLSEERYPKDAILTKRHDLREALKFLLWPSLVLLGGVLLVGLVILTQFLAHLCNQIIQEEEEGMEDGQSTGRQNKLNCYLPCSPST